MKHKISVNLLIKDYETTIAKCLDSILDKGLTDIVCTFDSRTKQETRDIVANWFNDNNLPYNHYDYVWKTQHSANALNFGKSKCTGDWCMKIDGDETLETFGEIDERADFYEAKIINNMQGQDKQHLSVRLFKNREDIFYRGVYHASVETSLMDINAVRGETEFSTRHTGYDNLTDEQWQEKLKSIRSAYEMQLVEEPDNPRNFYDFCTWSFAVGEFQECIDYGTLSLFKGLAKEVNAQVCLLIYFSYKKLNKTELGIFWLQMSDNIYPSQSSKAQLINFYNKIKDKSLVIRELQNLEQLIITGSRFPNDMQFRMEDVELKLTEALKGDKLNGLFN